MDSVPLFTFSSLPSAKADGRVTPTNTKTLNHQKITQKIKIKNPLSHVSDPVIRIPTSPLFVASPLPFGSAMTRRCSHCSHNGHNSRTCPNRGVKLFGVRLTDGSIRKSASMGNLTHYAGGSGSGPLHAAGSNSPGETPDHGVAAAVADGYASEDFVPGSSSSRERKKGSTSFLHLIIIFK